MDQEDRQYLRVIGERVAETFSSFAHPLALADRLPSGRHISSETERFQLWAHSLGLYHEDHASLDYRVRDSDLVRDRPREVMLEVQEHLNNLLAIAKGERGPAEQDQDSASLTSSSGSSSDSSYVEQQEHIDLGSFDEVGFRLQGLTERLDTLYTIATRIRNPKNRPSKTNDQLYGNISHADRGPYRKEREEIETLTAAYLHRQYLLGILDSQDKLLAEFHSEELISQRHMGHDLQAYHCTYEQCQDSNRLYGTVKEWIDHESQHVQVWHCRKHQEEFETQPDYVHHLKMMHTDSFQEMFSDQLIGAVVAPSEHLHRGCPYCPSSFTDTADMQKHIIHHLERFALLACPSLDDDTEIAQDYNPSNESHHTLLCGREHSLVCDFPGIRELALRFLEIPKSTSFTQFKINTIFYSLENAAIICLLKSNQMWFSIDYPFEIISELCFIFDGFNLELTKPPLFKLLSRSSQEYVPCSDFTEDELASSRLRHTFISSNGALLKRQLQGLHLLVPFPMFNGLNDFVGGSFGDNFGPKLTLPNTPVPSSDMVSGWVSGCQQSLDESVHRNRYKMSSEGNEESNEAEINESSDVSNDSHDSDGHYDSDDSVGSGHYWSSRARYKFAQYVSTMSVKREAYISNPPVLKYVWKAVRMDPDCAICMAPAGLQCDCESKAMDAAIRQAEEKMMSVILYESVSSPTWMLPESF
ncbi:hypothetical protein PG994_002400 [Apiospora phragmitis]|uniref:C2H2-type domain-containing protein n=1 Tax=Apiospora phragmitis TaxID=2905665 RepID=A0ABR1WW87_9PEZI